MIHTIHIGLGRAHGSKAKLLGGRRLRHLTEAKLAHTHTQPLDIARVALVSLASGAKSSSARANRGGRGDRCGGSGSLGFGLLSFGVVPQFLNALCLFLGLALHLIKVDVTGNNFLGTQLGGLLSSQDTALLRGSGCGGLAGSGVCANSGRGGRSSLLLRCRQRGL